MSPFRYSTGSNTVGAGRQPYERSRPERKKVEMPFAHLKRHLGFERLRLRGLSGAQDEFLLAAGVDVDFHILDSVQGHDSFLIAMDQFRPAIGAFF